MNLARHFVAPYKGSKIGGPAALGVHPKLAPNTYQTAKPAAPFFTPPQSGTTPPSLAR
jgi:hypothetical protein